MPVGRKIGFTNRTIWAEYNVYGPICGYVYNRTKIVFKHGRCGLTMLDSLAADWAGCARFLAFSGRR